MNISDKEREILGHLCEGKAYKEIAFEVGIGHSNTKKIIKALRKRFDCPNSISLAIYAQKHILSNQRYPDKTRKVG